jgi:hypothetical protein
VADDRREPSREEAERHEEEERERGEEQPKEGEPWAKIGSGDTDSMTSD